MRKHSPGTTRSSEAATVPTKPPKRQRKKGRNLTQNQIAFAHAYVRNGGDATSAFLETYNCKMTSRNAIYAEAGRTRNHPRVAALIDELAGYALQAAAVTPERIIAELAKIGFSDIRHAVRWKKGRRIVLDQEAGEILKEDALQLVPSDEIDPHAAAAIAEISEGKDGVRLKLHSKRAALESLARIQGMIRDPGGGTANVQIVLNISADEANL